jgi:hypothetical protein
MDISDKEKEAVFTDLIFPVSGGIAIHTCTATGSVELHKTDRKVTFGACVGWSDIKSVSGLPDLPEKVNRQKQGGGRTCVCYPFTDVGSQRDSCVHGCRYCFMNPKMYDF